jgi:hypothetical protein
MAYNPTSSDSSYHTGNRDIVNVDFYTTKLVQRMRGIREGKCTSTMELECF